MPWSATGSKLQEKACYGEQEKEVKQEDYYPKNLRCRPVRVRSAERSVFKEATVSVKTEML